MTPTEAAILAVLAPGGVLSTAQIQRQTALSAWRTRRVLEQLRGRGLVVVDARRGRWQMSERGRAFVAKRSRSS